jgi:hypothetical protein
LQEEPDSDDGREGHVDDRHLVVKVVLRGYLEALAGVEVPTAVETGCPNGEGAELPTVDEVGAAELAEPMSMTCSGSPPAVWSLTSATSLALTATRTTGMA